MDCNGRKRDLITEHERDVLIKRDIMIINCTKYDEESKTEIDDEH